MHRLALLTSGLTALLLLAGCSLRPRSVTVVLQGDGFVLEPADPVPPPTRRTISQLSQALRRADPTRPVTVYRRRMRIRLLQPVRPLPSPIRVVAKGLSTGQGSCPGGSLTEGRGE